MIREARDWGLLGPDPDSPGFLRLQPILPYFLRNRLNAPEQVEVRKAIEIAFHQLYDQLSDELYQLLESKDPQERLVGQVITGLEYENLVTALKLALAAPAPVSNPYFALSTYLDSTQEKRRGAQLDEMVLKQVEAYPHEKRVGPLGEEVVRIMGTFANRQRDLKQYKAAETTSQRLLEVLDQVEQLDEKARNMLKASAYHDLGAVAQEQRQWRQAEEYYQHALQIYIEYQDRYSQARTYHQLGWVAEEQRKFQQARDYFLIALETFAASNDTYSAEIVWRSLGWLWQTSGDTSLSATIASALDMPPAEVETLLRRMLGNEAEGGQTK